MTRHENTLDLGATALAVIDVQEAFRGAIADFAGLAERCARVARGAQILGVPVVVTEQYPKGLGHTAAEIREALTAEVEIIEKTAFSSCGASPFVAALEGRAVRHVLLCGIEAHICVNQTAHDLLARGYKVHLLADCISARSELNREAGLSKMLASGALHSSTELALFELMRDARHEQFKAIQKLIK